MSKIKCKITVSTTRDTSPAWKPASHYIVFEEQVADKVEDWLTQRLKDVKNASNGYADVSISFKKVEDVDLTVDKLNQRFNPKLRENSPHYVSASHVDSLNFLLDSLRQTLVDNAQTISNNIAYAESDEY